jgi:hypothetical protein
MYFDNNLNIKINDEIKVISCLSSGDYSNNHAGFGDGIDFYLAIKFIKNGEEMELIIDYIASGDINEYRFLDNEYNEYSNYLSEAEFNDILDNKHVNKFYEHFKSNYTNYYILNNR